MKIKALPLPRPPETINVDCDGITVRAALELMGVELPSHKTSYMRERADNVRLGKLLQLDDILTHDTTFYISYRTWGD